MSDNPGAVTVSKQVQNEEMYKKEDLEMKRTLVATITMLALTAIMAGPVLAARDGIIAPDVSYVDDYTLAGSVNYFTQVDPADKSGNVHVIVEIPSGTTGKWEVSPDTGNIVWEFKKGKPRTVEYKGGYPVNYGTAPKTVLSKEMGGEGESVDVILFGAQQKRGAVVKAKLIGVLKIQEGDGAYDDKLLAVAQGTPEYDVKDVDELNARFNNVGTDVASWFTNYKGPDSGLTSRGIGSPDEAMRLFYATMKAYKGKN
jgi:inorganic pyrophosphatase